MHKPPFDDIQKPGARRHSAGKLKTMASETPLKAFCRRLADNNYFSFFTFLLTVAALWGADVQAGAFNKPADPIFDIAVWGLCLVVFAFEIGVLIIGKDDYWMGFFFWLDVISTVTLLLDISVINAAIFDRSDDEGGSANALRAGRASRAGSKAGRVVRIIRLIRILKLYKAVSEAKAKKKAQLEAARMHPGEVDDDEFFEEEEDPEKQGQESRVGKKLSDMSTRRVICLVLAMLGGQQALDPGIKPESADMFQYGADMVYQSFIDFTTAEGTRVAYERQLLKYIYYGNIHATKDMSCNGDCESTPDFYFNHIFWIGVGGTDDARRQQAHIQDVDIREFEKTLNVRNYNYQMGTMAEPYLKKLSEPWAESCGSRDGVSLLFRDESYEVTCPEDLRFSERQVVMAQVLTPDEHDEFHFAFYVDRRNLGRTEAWMNSLNTIFICIVLAAGSMLFSKDANELVLNPVEQMINKVERIRDNPLYAMKLGDEEFKREEIAKKKKAEKKENSRCTFTREQAHQEPMETVILEKTIIKIGTLLALGFGEAGANIIGQNMKGGESAGVNAMIPGHRIHCVIGVVCIRDFGIATEVLQAHVMTFVNQVAEIVHGVTDEFHGAPNRNNGDTFLLVWRCEFQSTTPVSGVVAPSTSEGSEGERGLSKKDKVTRMAEMSMMAFVKIIASVNRSPVLADYRDHPGLLQRIIQYRVSLGFGLHYGWAIEGAIGSEFKIDASYLSPNVNVAARLENATRDFRVSMLLSESVVDLMGPGMSGRCRLLDRVVLPGTTQPQRVFTVDLQYSLLGVDTEKAGIGDKMVWNTRQRFKVRQILEQYKLQKWSINMNDLFEQSEDVSTMRSAYTERFFQIYAMGYHNYIAGEWGVAAGLFRETRTMLEAAEEDGPSTCLLAYMESFQFAAPAGWIGFRKLELA